MVPFNSKSLKTSKNFPSPPNKSPQGTSQNQNIKVFIRCRPLKNGEKHSNLEIFTDKNEIRIKDRNTYKSFCFDSIFDETVEQVVVYKRVVAPLIEKVLEGYNCTVFAYGQTGTGKTYTMEGIDNESETKWETDPLCGLIPRSFQQMFEALETERQEHTVRVSYLELYNEELFDLLSSSEDITQKLKIYDDITRKGSVVIGNSEELTVNNKEEIYEILKRGSARRQKAATLLNSCSSRSHTIFSITVHLPDNSVSGDDYVRIGKLNLVDLAGSENVSRSGATDKRAREASSINQSLLTLGRVITSLLEKASHIPYRESKLTRILQDSLGGKTSTSIIATISPDYSDFEDTLNTLEYAQRAKKITNKPRINQKLSRKGLLKEYAAEIERLQKDLQASREGTGIYVNKENYTLMKKEIDEKNKLIKEKEERLESLNNEMRKLESLFKSTEKKLEETQNDLEIHKEVVRQKTEKEKQIKMQARQLASFVLNSNDTVQRLYDKIDRVKKYDEENISKIKAYKNKLQQEVKSTDSNLCFWIENINEKVNGFISSINKCINCLRQPLSVLGMTLKSLEGHVGIIVTNAFNTSSKLQLAKKKTNSLKGLFIKSIDTLFTNFKHIKDFEKQKVALDYQEKIVHLFKENLIAKQKRLAVTKEELSRRKIFLQEEMDRLLKDELLYEKEASEYEQIQKQYENEIFILNQLKSCSHFTLMAEQRDLSNILEQENFIEVLNTEFDEIETVLVESLKKTCTLEEADKNLRSDMGLLFDSSSSAEDLFEKSIRLTEELSSTFVEELNHFRTKISRQLSMHLSELEEGVIFQLKKDIPTGMTPKKLDMNGSTCFTHPSIFEEDENNDS